MASETIFSVTASLVLWEGVYEFTPHYSCNKHTIPSIVVGERSAFSRRSAQLLNGDRKLFCTIRCSLARTLACCCVCFASIFVGKSSVCSMQRLIFCFLLCDNPGHLHTAVRACARCVLFWCSFARRSPLNTGLLQPSAVKLLAKQGRRGQTNHQRSQTEAVSPT